MKLICNYLCVIFSISISFDSHAQSCQNNKGRPSTQKSITFEKQLTAANSRSDTVDILKYTINLNITDFITNTISGNTVVKFTPKINGVSKINLDLLQLIIDSVKQNSSTVVYTYDDTLLSVNLSANLNPTDTSSVIVYYHGTPQMDHPSGWR